jgi:hypothetical protein
MTDRKPPTAAELTDAAAHWRSLNKNVTNERAAQALEIRRDTGVTVCVCCLKPLSERNYWQR